MASKISILLVGSDPFPTLPRILDYEEDNKYNLICFNMLDYELPSESDNIKARWYRQELRRAFRLLKDVDTSTTDIELDLLRDNDHLGLDDVDLELNAWITKVFDQKPSSIESYKFLSGQLSKSNIDLYPLVSDPLPFYVTKGFKYSPLRYYIQTKELIKSDKKPEFLNESPDELTFWNTDKLETVEMEENTYTKIKDSDLLLILVSDLASLGILAKSDKIITKLNSIDVPYVMIWPPEYTDFDSFADKDVFKHLGLGSTLDKLIDILASSVNFIITKSDVDEINSIITETGYKTYDEIENPAKSKNQAFLDFLHEIELENSG